MFQTAGMQSMYLCFYSSLYTMQSTYLVPWSKLYCKPRVGDNDGQGGLVNCKMKKTISLIFGFVGFCANLFALCPHGISVGGCDLHPSPSTHYNTTPLPSAINLLYQSPISLSATHMLIFKWIAISQTKFNVSTY